MKRRVILNIDGVLVATKKWVTKDGKLFGIQGEKNLQCSDRSKSGYKYHYVKNGIASVTRERHTLIANCFCVNPRPGYFTCVDHKDGNHLNNHVDNLRYVTNQLNQLNRKSKRCKASTRSSTNPYRATIRFYKNIHLGCHKTAKEAFDIMDKIRQELFDKLYDFETRPMCYMPPEYWKISKYGVDVM
jgi:hypothetical protein